MDAGVGVAQVPWRHVISRGRRATPDATQGQGAEHDLGVFLQPSGKRLRVWALEGDCDPRALSSNLFEMEWPPKSGRIMQFPEADRGGWFEHRQALVKIASGQRPILERFYAELR